MDDALVAKETIRYIDRHALILILFFILSIVAAHFFYEGTRDLIDKILGYRKPPWWLFFVIGTIIIIILWFMAEGIFGIPIGTVFVH